MLQVYDRVIVSGHLETLVSISVLAFFALVFLGFFDSMRSRALARIGNGVFRRHAPSVLDASLRYATKNGPRSGVYLKDLGQIQNFFSTGGIIPFLDAPFAPFFVALIFVLHPALGILTLLGGLVLFVIALIAEQGTRKAALTARSEDMELTRLADALLANAEYLESSGTRKDAVARYRGAADNSLSVKLSMDFLSADAKGLSKAIRLILQSAALGLGAFFVLRGEMSAGGMIAGSILLSRALAPVEQSIGAWRMFKGAQHGLRSLRQLGHIFPDEKPKTRLPTINKSIEVSGLSFAHAPSKPPLFGNVSFKSQPGELIGLVGPSGCGKTTLCRLLTGAEKTAVGHIILSGTDISKWDAEQLGRIIGYLPQHLGLFPGTIAENIASFRSNYSDDDVVEAAISTDAHRIITSLPEAYNTRVGLGGFPLSGGQLQIIGLARANYLKPAFLILDEPTAHLDVATKTLFSNFLKTAILNEQPIIVSTHDQKLAAACDKLIMLSPHKTQVHENKHGANAIIKRAISKDNAKAVEDKQAESSVE